MLTWKNVDSYSRVFTVVKVPTSCTNQKSFSRVFGQELDVINMIFCICTPNNEIRSLKDFIEYYK